MTIVLGVKRSFDLGSRKRTSPRSLYYLMGTFYITILSPTKEKSIFQVAFFRIGYPPKRGERQGVPILVTHKFRFDSVTREVYRSKGVPIRVTRKFCLSFPLILTAALAGHLQSADFSKAEGSLMKSIIFFKLYGTVKEGHKVERILDGTVRYHPKK